MGASTSLSVQSASMTNFHATAQNRKQRFFHELHNFSAPQTSEFAIWIACSTSMPPLVQWPLKSLLRRP